jgi:hypothetical protein
MSQGPTSDHERGPSTGGEDQRSIGGKTPSTASNASFDNGAGDAVTGFDSPPVTSSQLGNTDVDVQSATDDADLNYPPGGGPDADGPRGINSTEDAGRHAR